LQIIVTYIGSALIAPASMTLLMMFGHSPKELGKAWSAAPPRAALADRLADAAGTGRPLFTGYKRCPAGPALPGPMTGLFPTSMPLTSETAPPLVGCGHEEGPVAS
jgi:hypothetical protein